MSDDEGKRALESLTKDANRWWAGLSPEERRRIERPETPARLRGWARVFAGLGSFCLGATGGLALGHELGTWKWTPLIGLALSIAGASLFASEDRYLAKMREVEARDE